MMKMKAIVMTVIALFILEEEIYISQYQPIHLLYSGIRKFQVFPLNEKNICLTIFDYSNKNTIMF